MCMCAFFVLHSALAIDTFLGCLLSEIQKVPVSEIHRVHRPKEVGG